jgi:hypothetical protein
MHRRRPRRRHVDRGGVVSGAVSTLGNWRFGSPLARRTRSAPSPRPCGERVASPRMRASRVRGNVSRRADLPSPAGLTTQVGFTRLAHLKRPKSGVPDFGWSILFVRTFLRTGWIAPQLGLARVAQHNAPQVGLTRLAVSSPAMTTAIAARIGPSPGPRYARAALSPLRGARVHRVRGVRVHTEYAGRDYACTNENDLDG